MPKMYSIQEMINIAIKEYRLVSNGNQDDDRAMYYQKFQSVIKNNLKLWDTAPQEIRAKNKTKVFSEEQMRNLFSSRYMYDYLRDHSTDDDIHNSKRYNEIEAEVEERRRNYIAFLDEEEQIDGFAPAVKHEDMLKIKQSMMIEAIFNLFFTPFNEALLEHDLTHLLLRDEMALTPEQIEAEKRFSNPNGIYYKEKQR